MSIVDFGRYDEAAFAIGTVIGITTFALGLAFLVLALSVGVREGSYLTETQDLLLKVGGLLLFGIGIALRLFYERLSRRYWTVVRYGGGLTALLGAMAALYSISAETTVSAPYLATPVDKAVLFIISFVFIILGLLLIRGSGRVVGW